MSKRWRLLLASMAVLAWAAFAAWGDDPRRSAMLEEADQKFAEAVKLREARSAGADAMFLDAGRMYEAVWTSGVRNADLAIDAGNAYLLGGDTGRAVLSFLRADHLRPEDPAVRSGLAEARARVQTVIQPSARAKGAGWLLAWRSRVPRHVVFGGFIVLYACAWLYAAGRHVVRRSLPAWPGIAAGAVATVLIALLTLDRTTTSGVARGVVVSEGVTARNGPSAVVYQPTFTTPLQPGVELEILQERDGWFNVKLLDGRQTWLPGHAVERVVVDEEPAPQARL